MSRNNALHLPPGDPEGFNANEELIEVAAHLLLNDYVLPQNCKVENIGFCSAPKDNDQKKLWITGTLKSFSEGKISTALNVGHVCYGAAHANFSNLLVIDIDAPDSGDEDVIREMLDDLEWAYKCFHSGRGRHFWIFFEDLPWNLLGPYRSGSAVMKAVGETLLRLHSDRLTEHIDLRGCGKQLIKLPLQYDPYHKWIVMPFTDDGVLIEEYELAVEYAGMIQRNDSDMLYNWLKDSMKELGDQPEILTYDRKRYESENPDISESFRAYLDKVQVRLGELNDFIFELVKCCRKEGLNEEDIPQIVSDLYTAGKGSRITCKDYLADWLSKAKGRAQWYYNLEFDYEGSDGVSYYQSDLDWLRMFAESGRDRLFLSIHLWAYRLNKGEEYFLSRPKATEFGISNGQFRLAKQKFEKSGLVKVVKNGKAGARLPGLRGTATKYQLTELPEECYEVLDVSDPRELIEMLREMDQSGEEEVENGNLQLSPAYS